MALLLVVPELTSSAKICPELLIVTLFAVPEFSVRVMVLVLLFIIPPALFVILESCAFNKLIALEPPELIVPELVTVNPVWSFPWTVLWEVAVKEDPECIVRVPFSFSFILTGACPVLDKVEEFVMVNDVSSAL